MGLAAFRLLGTSAAREFGFPVADPLAGPPVLADAGRADLRRPHRHRAQPGRPVPHAARPRRHGGPVGGRPAAAVRRPAAVAHPAVAPAVPAPGAAPGAPAPHAGPRVIRGLANPDAVHRDQAALPDETPAPALHARHRHARPSDSTSSRTPWPPRSSRSRRRPWLPAAGGFVDARRWPGSSPAPARANCRRCCAACRTTSPPRWTWSCGGSPAPSGRTPPRPSCCCRRRRQPSRAAGETALCRRSSRTASRTSSAGTATAPSPRSTSACPAGPTTRRTSSACIANYLRLDDDRAAPGRRVRPRRGARRSSVVQSLVDRAGPHPSPGGPLRARPRPPPGRRAGDAEVPPGRGASASSAPSSPWWAAHWPPTAASRRRTTSSCSTTAEARAGLSGADLHDLVAARRDTYDAELRRRRIPRVLLSDGTEPEAAAVGGGRTGRRPGRHAGLGRRRSPRPPASSWTRSAPTSSRARSWSPRRPTPAGRRSS